MDGIELKIISATEVKKGKKLYGITSIYDL